MNRWLIYLMTSYGASFFISSSGFAQQQPVLIDTAYMECTYKTSYYLDTIKFEKGIMMGGEFILLVGPKTSKYYEKVTDKYERIQSDPEIKAAYNKEMELVFEKARANGGFLEKPILSRVDALVIYTNYPEGKRTVQDAAFLDYYIYEDDLKPQQWTMVPDSVKTKLDYSCRKAVCTYRGRAYEAWYCPDIPVSLGPWKFSGLPGLIMSVRDTNGHYTFDISGLEKSNNPIEYIEYITRKYTHTDRITFLRNHAKSAQIGIVKYLQANAPASTTNNSGTNDNGLTSQFVGGTAKYDLLERDYKKIDKPKGFNKDDM